MTTTQSDPAALAAAIEPIVRDAIIRLGCIAEGDKETTSLVLRRCASQIAALLHPAQGQVDGQSGVEERMLLRKWASLSKGLGLTQRSGNVADFDDELASLLVEAATATLKWREDEFLTAPPPSAPAQGSAEPLTTDELETLIPLLSQHPNSAEQRLVATVRNLQREVKHLQCVKP